MARRPALVRSGADGNLFIDKGFEGLKPGDLVEVRVEEAGAYDLWGAGV